MAKKTSVIGLSAFDEFYGSRFGKRWAALRAALLVKHAYFEIKNGLSEPYYLDNASVLAVTALDLSPGQVVLDMCAAPGGKALLIAQGITESGQLTLNERSLDRFHRLRRTMALLKSPPTLMFSRSDARRYGMENPGLSFERILLDAPCSSEAHVLKSPLHLSQWNERRPKRLAIEQVAMLCQALELCADQGKIVYSTCSINEEENDAVITKMLKKRPNFFTIEPLDLQLGEKTKHGWQVWPDLHEQGPLYIACLKRQKNS